MHDFLISLIAIPGMLFLAYVLICVLAVYNNPLYPNSYLRQNARELPQPKCIVHGELPGWRNGQALTVINLDEFLSNKPGRTVYWDAINGETVESLDPLNNPNQRETS